MVVVPGALAGAGVVGIATCVGATVCAHLENLKVQRDATLHSPLKEKPSQAYLVVSDGWLSCWVR